MVNEAGAHGGEVFNLEADGRRSEIQSVGVVLHHLERHQLEGEVLVGEANLRDDVGPRLTPLLLDHANLINPEGAAGLNVIHIQHYKRNFHAPLPCPASLQRRLKTIRTRSESVGWILGQFFLFIQ